MVYPEFLYTITNSDSHTSTQSCYWLLRLTNSSYSEPSNILAGFYHLDSEKNFCLFFHDCFLAEFCLTYDFLGNQYMYYFISKHGSVCSYSMNTSMQRISWRIWSTFSHMKIPMYVPRPAVLLETCAATAPISIIHWYVPHEDNNHLLYYFLNYENILFDLLVIELLPPWLWFVNSTKRIY